MPEPWLTDLEAALFARLPAEESGWHYHGEVYEVERRLENDGRGALDFVESWSDPRTHSVKGSWRLPLEAGAFVGIPGWLLQQSVAALVRAIEQRRPQPRTRTTPPTFTPGRFAAQTRERPP